MLTQASFIPARPAASDSHKFMVRSGPNPSFRFAETDRCPTPRSACNVQLRSAPARPRGLSSWPAKGADAPLGGGLAPATPTRGFAPGPRFLPGLRARSAVMRIFLSFNAKDAVLAEAVRTGLMRLEPGTVFSFSPMALGQGLWLPKFADGIRAADAFLLLLGPHGVSPWQELEYYEAFDRHAHDNRFPIVPLIAGSGHAPRKGSVHISHQTGRRSQGSPNKGWFSHAHQSWFRNWPTKI